jgi:hypothetical protein
MSETEQLNQKHQRKLRIAGPSHDCGCFFIHDTDDRVWDGKTWRGFGPAWHYSSFLEAFTAMKKKALRSHVRVYFKVDAQLEASE